MGSLVGREAEGLTGSGPARPSDGALRDLLTAGVSKVSRSKHIFELRHVLKRISSSHSGWYTQQRIYDCLAEYRVAKLALSRQSAYETLGTAAHLVCGRLMCFGASCV